MMFLICDVINGRPLFFLSSFKTSRGVNLKIYSSNAHGRSIGHVQLETTPSKVAELQIGKFRFKIKH